MPPTTPASDRRRTISLLAGAATRLLPAVRAYTATQNTTASVRGEAVSLRFDLMDAQRPTHYFYEIYQTFSNMVVSHSDELPA